MKNQKGDGENQTNARATHPPSPSSGRACLLSGCSPTMPRSWCKGFLRSYSKLLSVCKTYVYLLQCSISLTYGLNSFDLPAAVFSLQGHVQNGPSVMGLS